MINAEVPSVFNVEIPLFNSSPGTSYVEGYSLSGQAVLSNVTTGCDTASSYIKGMTVDTLRKVIYLIEGKVTLPVLTEVISRIRCIPTPH